MPTARPSTLTSLNPHMPAPEKAFHAHAALLTSCAQLSKPALYFCAIVNLLVVDALVLLTNLAGRVLIQIDYIVSRLSGLHMEVLGLETPRSPLS